MEIRHHPADEMLLALAAGQLEAGTRLVTASHLESCPECRARVRMLQAVGGAMVQAEAPEPMADDALAAVLGRINEADTQARPRTPARKPGPPPLPQDAVWPRALAQCTATRWRWIAPGMRWSRVTVPGAPQ